AQSPDQPHRGPRARWSAGRPESPEPGHERRIRAELDVEGALGVEHPLDALPPHPRSGQGQDVARRQQPGIAVRAARADLAPPDQGHRPAVAREVVGGGDADAAAPDDYRPPVAHEPPLPQMWVSTLSRNARVRASRGDVKTSVGVPSSRITPASMKMTRSATL